MTLEQIKRSVDDGLKVFWHHTGYRVIKTKFGDYLIEFEANGHCCPLAHEFPDETADNPSFFGAISKEGNTDQLRSDDFRYIKNDWSKC